MTTARGVRVALVGVLIASTVALSGCVSPPALTQAQIDAKKTPKKHPVLSEKQRSDCQSCHKVIQGSASTTPGSPAPASPPSTPLAPKPVAPAD